MKVSELTETSAEKVILGISLPAYEQYVGKLRGGVNSSPVLCSPHQGTASGVRPTLCGGSGMRTREHTNEVCHLHFLKLLFNTVARVFFVYWFFDAAV